MSEWRTPEYWEGYDVGFAAAERQFARVRDRSRRIGESAERVRAAPKRKRRQSGKQKLLTDMAGKKWKSYKRNTPKGKKTYIDIRAQVSRSQAYKKKARRLK